MGTFTFTTVIAIATTFIHGHVPGGAIPTATPVAGVTKATQTKATQVSKGGALGGIDVGLAVYFFFWYLGNYYYNIVNKLALKAAGGEYSSYHFLRACGKCGQCASG